MSLTAQAIEARNYSYCHAQGWGEPKELHVYPRNYVISARRLFAEGRYPSGGDV